MIKKAELQRVMWIRSIRGLEAFVLAAAVLLAILISAGSVEATPKKSQRPKPAVVIGGVASRDQTGGATIGHVGTFNQTVLPNLVRGPLLAKFKDAFTEGAWLFRQSRPSDINDLEIETLCSKTDAWIRQTSIWLETDVSAYANERFLFRPAVGEYIYSLPGEHKANYPEYWGNCRATLREHLINLDQLMREPTIYPDAPVKK